MEISAFRKILVLSYVVLGLSFNLLASESLALDVKWIENQFHELTQTRISKVKEGSRPFLLSQNKISKTVVMIHGLSDSPGSMKEVAQVYYKRGYNVVTVLLRDHGLLPEYRHSVRANIKLANWREDIDQLMSLARQMSPDKKVALIGFSMGGALALDVANRYEGQITSLVLMAPLLKMNHAWLANATRALRHVKYSIFKGIPEAEHFYPDIALNQTYQALLLTKQIKKNVTRNPKESLLKMPKMMFLTDADTTIENDYALEMANRLEMGPHEVIIYSNPVKISTALHRDLPMRKINASGVVNPHIEDLLTNLDRFLSSIE